MNTTMMELARYECRVHFLRRAAERGIAIDDLARFEAVLERIRPVFANSPRHRQLLTVIRHGVRLRVVYDSHLGCVVSVWLHKWQRR